MLLLPGTRGELQLAALLMCKLSLPVLMCPEDAERMIGGATTLLLPPPLPLPSLDGDSSRTGTEILRRKNACDGTEILEGVEGTLSQSIEAPTSRRDWVPSASAASQPGIPRPRSRSSNEKLQRAETWGAREPLPCLCFDMDGGSDLAAPGAPELTLPGSRESADSAPLRRRET